MKELQMSMKEVKETTKAAKTTYAHVAANPAMKTTLNTRHE
jgi:hypothetical protein